MSLLALDLGTTTGYKVGNKQASVSGTFDLKPSRWEGGGMRGVKFRNKLNEMHSAFKIAHVVYEEVHRHRGTDAAHIYGGLLMILTSWCEENHIPYEGVGVGSIKKFWTGKGNADKNAMIAECERRGFAPSDDNEADAIALFEMKIDEVIWSPAEDPPTATIAARGPPVEEVCSNGPFQRSDAMAELEALIAPGADLLRVKETA
jgi:crossover junction endodeoxyribonuclease RuvC